MKHVQPEGLDRRRVEQLLSKITDKDSTAGRIDCLSRCFLGCCYTDNPLIGSADTAEVFTASLDGFDCVTYIETVLALARAAGVDDFIEWLRKIRYDQGRFQWERRNHYMTLWIRNNQRLGLIKPVSTPGTPTVSKERMLNVVTGLPAVQTRFECVPKTAVPILEAHFQSGDLIFFVSTRKNLDVFHAGIIVRAGDKILMRHASRSQGGVVEQDLGEFLKANRMSGVIAMRPQPMPTRRVERTATVSRRCRV
jgi:hypothetical protein